MAFGELCHGSLKKMPRVMLRGSKISSHGLFGVIYVTRENDKTPLKTNYVDPRYSLEIHCFSELLKYRIEKYPLVVI